MKKIKSWCIRDNQWGTEIIEIRNETEVYHLYEDRSGGSDSEIYLGTLQEFVQREDAKKEKGFQEVVDYIRTHYLKE